MGAGDCRLQRVKRPGKTETERTTPLRHAPVKFFLRRLSGFLLAGGAGCFPVLPISGLAQPALTGRATGFNSVEYYAAPNPQQIKTRMSGAEAQPLAGGLLVIRRLQLETFNTNGVLLAVVEAPECVYDTTRGIASSAGPLTVQTGNGKIRLEGVGFLWRQSDSFLTISNHVRTTIESETKGAIAP